MTLGIGFGVERIGLAALRWPKAATALILALLVLIGASLPQLRFDDDIHRVFLSDSALSDAQRQYEAAQDPPISTVIAYVRSPAPFTLRDTALDLEFIDGVVGVASPFLVRMSPDATAPNGRPVFPAKIAQGYSADIAAFDALKTGLPSFINADRTALLINVTIDLDQTALSTILPLINAEFARARSAGLDVTLTGEEVISLEIVGGLKDDLMALNLWGGLIVTLAAFALFRDLRVVVLAVLPALCGAASVLALSVWLGYPITVLSNVIPILLLYSEFCGSRI
jgi:predicted RND superfamily exporter protein